MCCEPQLYTFLELPSGAVLMDKSPKGGHCQYSSSGRANLRNAYVTFSLFFGMKLLLDDINNIS